MGRLEDEVYRELARRQKYEKLRYFQPNGGQTRWIEEISRPGGFIVVNASGNGGGKTFGLIAAFGAFMWPVMAAPCFATPTFQAYNYPKRGRIISTPKEVEEVGSIQTAIKDLWPKGKYQAIRKGKSYPSQFITDTGWVVDVMTYEQDEGEFAGPNIGLVGFNEPPPEPIFRESIARTRKGGYVLMAFTSLNENPWVVDGILGKADGSHIRVIYSDIEDNCKEHGNNGHLSHEQIEKILSHYDPDEREARKTGKPLSLSGSIFKGFDRNVHVAKEPITPPEGVTHYQVIDPAIGKPLAVIWAYVDGAGVVHIYDEHPDTDFQGMRDLGWTVSDYALYFKQREKATISERILERHFGNARRTVGGLTLRQEFAEAGMGFIDSYSMDEEVETGILKVKDYLRYDKSKPIDSLNRPRLLISPTCTNTIKSLERWGRNPKTGKPMEEFKDFADCVRYLCMAEPGIAKTLDWGNRKMATWGVHG